MRRRSVEDDEQVWVSHYSSNHHILLLGEGDFSFSHSLATLFGSASNICASSLDSYDNVVRKYKKARSNLETLKRLGAVLLHGVDATKMHFNPDLRYKRFDRIIFNFPHAGFHSKESDSYLIQKHRELVLGFFHGAGYLLRADGQVHVSHKNKAPFCHWNLEELASRCFLVLMQCVPFERRNFPGYENKRGDGSRCDQPFILGECSTFKFRLCRVSKEIYEEKLKWKEVKERQSKYLQAFSNKQQFSFDQGYTEFQGVSQRLVSSDLRHRLDHNLRQVQDPLVHPRHGTTPLDYQVHTSQFVDHRFALEKTRVQFQSYSTQLDKLGYTERSSLLRQESPFETNPHRLEQYNERNHLNRGLVDIYGREMRTNFLHHGESLERRPFLCQDFPVQASQEPFYDRSNRFAGFSQGIYKEEIRTMLVRTSFTHTYTGESQERSLTRQRNLNIHPPQHW